MFGYLITFCIFVLSTKKQPTTMNTAKDYRLHKLAARNMASIEAVAGERISSFIWVSEGFVYFTLLASGRRMGCKMNAAGKVARIFPQT